MHPTIQALIQHFGFERLPVEGTLYRQTYRSGLELEPGSPLATAMIGLLCEGEPASSSCFHRLSHDEVWHFYAGNPFVLYLLYEDGTSREVIMGPDVLSGHQLQFTVPAGVWQAACMTEGGGYALFGCTMAPGFTDSCFEGGFAAALIEKYPHCREIIYKLSAPGHEMGAGHQTTTS